METFTIKWQSLVFNKDIKLKGKITVQTGVTSQNRFTLVEIITKLKSVDAIRAAIPRGGC